MKKPSLDPKPDPVTRQLHLLARSAELRASAAQQAQGFKKPLALADKARAAAQWAYSNPVLPLGVGLVLAIVLPKRTLLIWGGRLWGAWTAYNRVRSVVSPELRSHARRSRAPRK